MKHSLLWGSPHWWADQGQTDLCLISTREQTSLKPILECLDRKCPLEDGLDPQHMNTKHPELTPPFRSCSLPKDLCCPGDAVDVTALEQRQGRGLCSVLAVKEHISVLFCLLTRRAPRNPTH